MRSKSIENYNKFLQVLFTMLFGGVIIILLLQRIRIGGVILDECWYASEPVYAANGAKPYSEIWTQAPGVCLPLAIIFKFFIAIARGTTGIMLFARIFYLLWISSTLIIIYKYIKNIPLVFLFPILLFAPHTLFYIDYNTIGPVYLLLVCIIIFYPIKTDTNSELVKGLICGFISVRAIIGTPYIIMPCILIFIYILFVNRYKLFEGYIIGGVTAAILVLSYCATNRDGLAAVFRGINNNGYGSEVFANYYHTFMEIRFFVKPCLFAVMCAFGVKMLLRKRTSEKTIEIIIFIGCMMSFTYGMIQAIMQEPTGISRTDYRQIIRYTWFIAPLIKVFSNEKDKEVSTFYLIYPILCFSQYLFASFLNVSGPIEREYILYFCGVISTWAFWRVAHAKSYISGKQSMVILALLFSVVFCLMSMKCLYSYVYFKKNINQCSVKMESGIWKGCYLDKETAEFSNIAEDVLQENTDDNDTVLFPEEIYPALYLMIKGKPSTPTTMGVESYHLKISGYNRLNLYYSNVRKEWPTKIIYMNPDPNADSVFDKNEAMSIDDPKWKLTQFVQKHYLLKYNRCINGYRILIYEKMHNLASKG
jgi:hypothetical protein